jgi:hypothetical protein
VIPPAARSTRRSLLARSETFWLGCVLATTVPIIVAALRALVSSWRPAGDAAVIALRANDVLSRHPPMVGMWASASLYLGRDVNHPSPLMFNLLALPVRLLGSGPGTVVGVAAVNVLSVIGIGWWSRRRIGALGAGVLMALVATLVWSMGSEMLIDPWPTTWAVLPFLLLLVAVWSVADHDDTALPIVVIAGSLCVGSHLSYVILVPALWFLSAVVLGLRLRQRKGEAGRTTRQWALLALGVAGLCWIQPVVQQFTGSPGNLSALVQSANTAAPNPPTNAQAIQIVGVTLAVPPAWLPPSFGHPSFRPDRSGAPLWLCTIGLVILTGAWFIAAWLAWKRNDRVVLALEATAIVAVMAGLLTIFRMPIPASLGPTYVRWLWPLGLFGWFAAGFGLWRAALTTERWRPPRTLAARLRSVVLSMSAVLAVVAVSAGCLPANNGSSTAAWAPAALDQLVPAVVPQLPHLPILVDLGGPEDQIGPALVTELARRGFDVQVSNSNADQYGERRRWDGADMSNLVVRYGLAAGSGSNGDEPIAFRSGLTPDDQQKLTEVTQRLRDELSASTSTPLTPFGKSVFTIQKLPTDDPEWLLDGPNHPLVGLWHGPIEAFWGHPIIDSSYLDPQTLAEYTDLQGRSDTQTVGIFLYTSTGGRDH